MSPHPSPTPPPNTAAYWRTLCESLVDAHYAGDHTTHATFVRARQALSGDTPQDDPLSVSACVSDTLMRNTLLRHGVTSMAEVQRMGITGLMRLSQIGRKRAESLSCLADQLSR